jgi:plasmid stability protein
MERLMAGNLHVRNLDDELIARLKRRAARHGRSTEAEHREILRQALIGDVEPSFDTLAAGLRKREHHRESIIRKRGGHDALFANRMRRSPTRGLMYLAWCPRRNGFA